ncbi:hypothetical protein V6M85_09500 [Sulfolobus tengchongensis]|uniref:Thermopsin n=1 Tax=Sulfolobus tengchongensis TaxID=207809 RepID=A0AAX4KXZ7_9CREN
MKTILVLLCLILFSTITMGSVSINYSSYTFHDSCILYSYFNFPYFIEEKLIPINTTSINYVIHISYNANWTLYISTNLPNIFSIVVDKYILWSGFETEGLNETFIIPYMNPLNIVIWVMNYPFVIHFNETVSLGEDVTIPGEINNLYTFKEQIINATEVSHYVIPSHSSLSANLILPFNYTYAPVTVFNSSYYEVDVVKGLNGVTVLEVGFINYRNFTFYIYNTTNQRVYPATSITDHFVITNNGVETPFPILGSILENNSSLIIINSTSALLILNNKSVIDEPIYDVYSIEPSYILSNNKLLLGYSIFISDPGVYRITGNYNLLGVPYIKVSNSTYFLSLGRGYYFALSKTFPLKVNPTVLLFSTIISSIFTILILLINKIFR